MSKPCRLELNNSGAWKLLGRFDAARTEAADEIMNAAEALVKALNDQASGRTALASLRISTDESLPDVLMRWEPARGAWTDARTGEPT